MRITAALAVSMPLIGAAPLVTFEDAASLATQTVYFLVDAASFAHDKVVEALPHEYRSMYFRSQLDAKTYYAQHIAPVVETATGAAAAIVQPTKEVLAGVYVQLDAINHNLFDGVISEFEKKHPKRAGVIGSTLADRAMFVLWIYVLLGAAKRAVFGKRKVHNHKHCC